MNAFREQLVRNKYPAPNLRHEIADFLTAGGQFDRNDPRATAGVVAPNIQIIATPLVIGKTPLTIANSEGRRIYLDQHVGSRYAC